MLQAGRGLRLSSVEPLRPSRVGTAWEKRRQVHERQHNGSRASLSPERGPEFSPEFLTLG